MQANLGPQGIGTRQTTPRYHVCLENCVAIPWLSSHGFTGITPLALELSFAIHQMNASIESKKLSKIRRNRPTHHRRRKRCAIRTDGRSFSDVHLTTWEVYNLLEYSALFLWENPSSTLTMSSEGPLVPQTTPTLSLDDIQLLALVGKDIDYAFKTVVAEFAVCGEYVYPRS